jgi:hypothetical protein
LCFAQLPTSTSSWSSISGLSTKRLTSTLNDIIYYFMCLHYCSSRALSAGGSSDARNVFVASIFRRTYSKYYITGSARVVYMLPKEGVRYGASKESETPYFLEGCVARTLATAVPPPPDSVLPGRPSI